MRYKCNNCHDYDLCYICYHGDKHNLNHSFTRIETPYSNGIYLSPRLISKKCQLRSIFKGARVVPGIDWARDSQDRDQPGIVRGITRWNNYDSWRSAAYVKWEDGSVQLCRLGYKGHCDIQLAAAATGSIYYYPEHLPVLGQTMVTEYQHVIQNEHVSETAINSRMIESTLEDSEDTPVCSDVTTSDERLKQLENKIMEMEESQICAICMENKRDMVFLCGHGTCSTCANSLVSCHICRKTIQMKIRIY
ncbi:E3 ubiquitin-protein ligase MIB1-like [Anoplophora glabripennis]|uniref:E3 ubiquitin-protein ligase MIB1-like n=1 Tax=Anoplophora glabripennis TaxID=217634 RepID=UPI000873A339|nr:E3 ubiquitin-protein ligase MIB1-like [Anoplophora glabripennis]